MRILNLQYKKLTDKEVNGAYIYHPSLERSTLPPEKFGNVMIDLWENLVVNQNNDWSRVGLGSEAFSGIRGVLEFIIKLDNEHNFSHVLVPENWPHLVRSDLKVILLKRGISVVTQRELKDILDKEIAENSSIMDKILFAENSLMKAVKSATEKLNSASTKIKDYRK